MHHITPETAAILVADRRRAREGTARRHRSLAARFRRAAAPSAPVAELRRSQPASWSDAA